MPQTQALQARNQEVSAQSGTRGDLRPINPTDITVSEDTIVDIKEVERIVQVLKNKGSLPEVIITQNNELISGINALEAARQFGQSIILATVRRNNNRSTKLQLDSIKLDGGTQSRASINQQIVDEYAIAWRDGASFPPIIIFYDGENYWLADGFHRCRSAQQAGLDEIDADIRQGTRRDAVLYSVGANSNHGLRRSNEDKRRAVTTLLQDDEWKQWSDREIARRTGVHHDTVGRLRAELSGGIRQIEDGKAGRKVTRNGSTYTQQAKSPKEKPWTPKETEEVEIIGGKFKGKRAEVRVVSGNMAMCYVEGEDEDKRHSILISDMKSIKEVEEQPASIKQELREQQQSLGLGSKQQQVLPDVKRNEAPQTEQMQASATSLNAVGGDAKVAEVAIALASLTPKQMGAMMEQAAPQLSSAQLEAMWQALAKSLPHKVA